MLCSSRNDLDSVSTSLSQSFKSLSVAFSSLIHPQAETLAVYVAASLFLLMASIALWVGVALSLRVLRARQRVNGINTDQSTLF